MRRDRRQRPAARTRPAAIAVDTARTWRSTLGAAADAGRCSSVAVPSTAPALPRHALTRSIRPTSARYRSRVDARFGERFDPSRLPTSYRRASGNVFSTDSHRRRSPHDCMTQRARTSTLDPAVHIVWRSRPHRAAEASSAGSAASRWRPYPRSRADAAARATPLARMPRPNLPIRPQPMHDERRRRNQQRDRDDARAARDAEHVGRARDQHRLGEAG